MRDKNVLLCVTGGIAAFKAVLLLRLLTKAGARVRVIMSPNAARFVGPLTFEALSNHPVLTDLWQTGGQGGETHVRLAEWADLIVVAPATANTIARMVQGFADDLIAATLLCAASPVIVAPAMHTRMYDHPATQANLKTLGERGIHVVDPVVGDLASGFGPGRLAEPEEILEAITRVLTPQDLKDLRLVVTAGPTLEPLDPIRHITNHSTGKMGYAIAQVAQRRGGQVHLITGPTSLRPPPGVSITRIQTAAQMCEAVLEASSQADGIIMAAAVADYRPRHQAPEKLKKTGATTVLELEPTTDILAELGRRRSVGGEAAVATERPVLIGFAMETMDLERHAADKLRRKGCDLIVANNVRDPGAGFGHDTNQVTLLSRTGAVERLPLLSKEAVAGVILDRLAAFVRPSGGLDEQ